MTIDLLFGYLASSVFVLFGMWLSIFLDPGDEARTVRGQGFLLFLANFAVMMLVSLLWPFFFTVSVYNSIFRWEN